MSLEHAERDAVAQAETVPALEIQALSSVERPDLEDFSSTLSCPLWDAQKMGIVVLPSLAFPLAFRVGLGGAS